MQLDVVIFGGGAAGLWTLDAVVRRGASAVLLEARRLGAGQTIAAQGIIHGGLKYTLRGLLTASATEIRDMPQVWRECLAGRREPDLSDVRVRADHCHLWRTGSLASRAGMIGARFGLHVAPQNLAERDRPAALAGCPGGVARLDEQVIAPDSLLKNLFQKHRRRIYQIDAAGGVSCTLDPGGGLRSVELAHPATGCSLSISARHVVLAAGEGNADLRRRFGRPEGAMQRRPLHMVLLRGDLPELNGHCVDGGTTRITVTSDRCGDGRRVWQVGGQIAEKGVACDERTLLSQARHEIQAAIPGIDLTGVEWSAYRVNRAEGSTSGGLRPESVQLLVEGNVLTAWPTKLALAPVLAERIAETLAPFDGTAAAEDSELDDWPRPEVAAFPWESARKWWTNDDLAQSVRRAA
jgi:glycerol-3-phosphate dehydrogenase